MKLMMMRNEQLQLRYRRLSWFDSNRTVVAVDVDSSLGGRSRRDNETVDGIH